MGASPIVQPMYISSNYREHWVTPYPWVHHLKYSLCLLALTTENTGLHLYEKFAGVSCLEAMKFYSYSDSDYYKRQIYKKIHLNDWFMIELKEISFSGEIK